MFVGATTPISNLSWMLLLLIQIYCLHEAHLFADEDGSQQHALCSCEKNARTEREGD